MPYLNCPQCGLSVHSAAARSSLDECPRCAARLHRRVPLFRSKMPARLLAAEKEGAARKQAPG